MKNVSLFLLLALTISIGEARAQNKKYTLKIRGGEERKTNSNKEVKKLRVSDFFLYTGSNFNNNFFYELSDFNKLAPNSILLNRDLEGFTVSGGGIYSSIYGVFFQNNSHLTMNLGISFRDDTKKGFNRSPLLRLGVVYSNGEQFSNFLSKQQKFPYDTLTSSKGNAPIYLDSVYRESYFVSYNTEQVRLDASLIFQTKSSSRWSVFTGVGLNLGASINSKTAINYVESQYISSNNNASQQINISTNYNNDNVKYETEEFRNKSSFAFATYIPLGLDFRLGKKNNLWGKMHLFTELRPGLNFYNIPEIGTKVNSTMQSGLGLRVSL